VSQDVANDSAVLYCLGLESIREKLSNSKDFANIEGVVSVSSTVAVDSLVPDYCETTTDTTPDGGGGGPTVIGESIATSQVEDSKGNVTTDVYTNKLQSALLTFFVSAVVAIGLFVGSLVLHHRGRFARRRPRAMRMMQSRSQLDLNEYNLSPRANRHDDDENNENDDDDDDEDRASSFSDVWQHNNNSQDESSTVIAVMPTGPAATTNTAVP
jgi:hypothetical protein